VLEADLIAADGPHGDLIVATASKVVKDFDIVPAGIACLIFPVAY
jgi:hypothetical protein